MGVNLPKVGREGAQWGLAFEAPVRHLERRHTAAVPHRLHAVLANKNVISDPHNHLVGLLPRPTLCFFRLPPQQPTNQPTNQYTNVRRVKSAVVLHPAPGGTNDPHPITHTLVARTPERSNFQEKRGLGLSTPATGHGRYSTRKSEGGGSTETPTTRTSKT